MKDPHIHAEKMPMPGFGHVVTRNLIIEATGLVPSLPKTVGTGCGVRRPLAMTSTVPENMTCLSCREYAKAEYLKWADMACAAAEAAERSSEFAESARVIKGATPADLRDEECIYRDLAERFK